MKKILFLLSVVLLSTPSFADDVNDAVKDLFSRAAKIEIRFEYGIDTVEGKKSIDFDVSDIKLNVTVADIPAFSSKVSENVKFIEGVAMPLCACYFNLVVVAFDEKGEWVGNIIFHHNTMSFIVQNIRFPDLGRSYYALTTSSFDHFIRYLSEELKTEDLQLYIDQQDRIRDRWIAALPQFFGLFPQSWMKFSHLTGNNSHGYKGAPGYAANLLAIEKEPSTVVTAVLRNLIVSKTDLELAELYSENMVFGVFLHVLPQAGPEVLHASVEKLFKEPEMVSEKSRFCTLMKYKFVQASQATRDLVCNP